MSKEEDEILECGLLYHLANLLMLGLFMAGIVSLTYMLGCF